MLKSVGGHGSEPATRRAVIYARISDDRSGEGVKVARQIEVCRDEAEKHGFVVVATEVDDSISAYKDLKRPGFEATLEHIRAGRASVVLCWDLDRLARKLHDNLAVLDLCTGKKPPCPDLIVHTVTGSGIRGDDPSTHLTSQILTTVAHHESAHKARRVAAAAEARAKAGVLMATSVYAYADTGNRKPVEPAATAVREGFKEFLQTKTVAAAWRKMQEIDPDGAPATPGGARNALSRPSYAGIVTYRGVEYPDVEPLWEPLISEEDFRVAQAILSRPSRRNGEHDRGARKALLSVLARCGKCDGPMGAVKVIGGPNVGDYRGVRCRVHQHNTRKAEPIEAWVIAVLMTRLGLPDTQATVLPREPAVGSESMVKQWNELTSKRSRMADLWMSGAMPDQDYARLSRNLGDDLSALEDRLAKMQVEPETGAALPADPAYALIGSTLAALRTTIATLIDVTVMPTRPGRQAFNPDSVRITWRREPAPPDNSGRAAQHHPDGEWWANIQEWLDNGLAEAAEQFLIDSPPPPLTDDQRRVLWVALTPAADKSLEAEVD